MSAPLPTFFEECRYGYRHGRRNARSTVVGHMATSPNSSDFCRLILRRVQSPRAGAECDVAARRILIQLRAAIPDAGPAVDALFAIEDRNSAGARGDRLAGAHLDAHL